MNGYSPQRTHEYEEPAATVKCSRRFSRRRVDTHEVAGVRGTVGAKAGRCGPQRGRPPADSLSSGGAASIGRGS